MGGAQPLAVTMNDGVALCVEVDPARIERRIKTRYLDRETDDLETALAWVDEARCGRRGGVDRAARQLRRGRARAPATRLAARTSSPIRRARTIRWAGTCPAGLSLEDAAALRGADPDDYQRRAYASMAEHVDAMVGFLDAGAVVFDYGNNLRAGAELGGLAARPRVRVPGVRAGVRAPAVLRGQGPVPLGGARRATPRTSSRPTAPCPSCSPTTSACSGGSGWPRSAWRSRDCRRGSAGSATANARRPGSASTRWSRSASCPRRS